MTLPAAIPDDGDQARPLGVKPFLKPGKAIQWHYRAPDWTPGEPQIVGPMRVVRGDEQGIVAWLAGETPSLMWAYADGGAPRSVPLEERWTGKHQRVQGLSRWRGNGILRIAPAGESWSVWLFWEPGDVDAAAASRSESGWQNWVFAGWYVNLEASHLREDSAVFTSDHVLDLWIEPNGTVNLKDEDELEAATEQGRLTPEQADTIRANAEAARAAYESGHWAFDEAWATWRPDPTWTIPDLPEDARWDRVIEREITEPVSLTLPDGRLNRQAIGWTRQPLHVTDGIGRGRFAWGRNKRWEYWAITTPTHVVAITVSDLDYAAVNAIWVLNRQTGEQISYDAISPFGRSVDLPGTLGASLAQSRNKKVQILIDEVPGGTRLRAWGKRVHFDVLALLPDGHERLGVVVPWSEKLFQYTVKDVARPAEGSIWIDGSLVQLPPGESWATLDHGRGRWTYDMRWNWGAGSGMVDGRAIGLQVGGRWTDGTGSVENALVVGGHLSKISVELTWAYDSSSRAGWLSTWRVFGDGVELTFHPEHLREATTNVGIIASNTHQCFGTWTGQVRDDTGEWVQIRDLYGWAEDVHNRW